MTEDIQKYGNFYPLSKHMKQILCKQLAAVERRKKQERLQFKKEQDDQSVQGVQSSKPGP